MTTEIRFIALKSKKEKVLWIEVRTVFNVKTTTTTKTMVTCQGSTRLELL